MTDASRCRRISYDSKVDHIEMDEESIMRELLPERFVFCNSEKLKRYRAML